MDQLTRFIDYCVDKVEEFRNRHRPHIHVLHSYPIFNGSVFNPTVRPRNSLPAALSGVVAAGATTNPPIISLNTIIKSLELAKKMESQLAKFDPVKYLPAAAHPGDPSLIAYPVEIIVEIMEYLSPIQLVALGLTCTHLYTWSQEVARRRGEPRINLWDFDYIHASIYAKETFLNSINGFMKVTLGELLLNWMPKTYSLYIKPDCTKHPHSADDAIFIKGKFKPGAIKRMRVGKGKAQQHPFPTSWQRIKRKSEESKVQRSTFKIPKVLVSTAAFASTYPI